MKGVSEVIAIILILMITIAIAGLAYMFMSTTMSDVTSSAGSTVSSTTSSMETSFVIESISQGHIYVRNTGQTALAGLSVYIGNEAVNASVPASIEPGELGTINVTSIIFENDAVKVTSGNGISASKRASAEWYGAVGYWKLDEASGTAAYDSSPYRNTGTLTNGPTWTSGRYGSSLLFDGTNDYILINDNAAIRGMYAITVNYWIKPNYDTDLYLRIFEKSNAYSSYIDYNNATHGRLYHYVRNNSGSYGSSSSYVSFSQWSMITITYNSSYVDSFVNGVKINLNSPYTYNISGSVNSSTSNLIIGSNSGTIHFFNGTIDEVVIWNRVLSAQEILKLYNKAY